MAYQIKLKEQIVNKFNTQHDFADAAKELPQMVSNVVRGRVELPPWRQERWARILNSNPNEIFSV